MGKYKEHPKYNVVSLRVTDEEKAVLDEMRQREQTSLTDLMRKAITSYTSLCGDNEMQANI